MSKRVIAATCVLALAMAGLMTDWSARAERPAAAPAAPKAAEPPVPKAAPSRIVHVTVYPDSALVTREVEVPPGAGLTELVVTPLPQHTINTSLYAENANGLRVLTTRFRSRPVREDTRE